MRLVERAYVDVVEEHQHDQQNLGKYTQESYAAVERGTQLE